MTFYFPSHLHPAEINDGFALFQTTQDNIVHINLDIFPEKKCSIPISSINAFLEETLVKFQRGVHSDDHDSFLLAVKEFVNNNNNSRSDSQESQDVSGEVCERSYSAIVYLLGAILINDSIENGGDFLLKRGLSLDFQSNITFGAGLGSSASFGVCVAGAFYVYSKYSKFSIGSSLAYFSIPFSLIEFVEMNNSWKHSKRPAWRRRHILNEKFARGHSVLSA